MTSQRYPLSWPSGWRRTAKWLGTNVGGSFVERCHARIAKEKARRSSWFKWVGYNAVPAPEDEAIAKQACAAAEGLPCHKELVRTVVAALSFVRIASDKAGGL